MNVATCVASQLSHLDLACFFSPLHARQMCCTYRFQKAAVFALKQKNPTAAPSLATPVHAVPSFYKLCLTSPYLTPTSFKWGPGS